MQQFYLLALALAAAQPAAAGQTEPAPAPAPTPSPAATPVTVAGSTGASLTSKAAGGAVTLAVDKAMQDGRLSIRIVAANFGAAPAAFGPDAITMTLGGKPLRVASIDDLVGRQVSHGLRDSALARAAAAPEIAGFGRRDTTQDNSPGESLGGMPGERYAQSDHADDTDQRSRLQKALLGPTQVPPHNHVGGALLTDKVRHDAGTLDIAVAFAGDVHRFAVRLDAK